MHPGSKVRRREGDLLKIDLGGGHQSYAQVAAGPLMIFFERASADDLAPEDVSRLPVLFRLWVANHAVTHGRWPVIGRVPLNPESRVEPFFYKQDVMTGRLSLYHSTFAAPNWERAATYAECAGLEAAAVWEPEHVEDRLRDHFAGRPNKWVESLRINEAAIP
ncbi:Imm26 family immunity protein [Sphingomonas kyungheensis]|uniref:Imm26 family immunity protein n=1 Tax=Sphingomonas kyungheensis TaxID=1069987 RepID=UPI00356B6D62